MSIINDGAHGGHGMMYKLGIRGVQKARGADWDVDDLEEEMCEMYRIYHLDEDEDEDEESDSDDDTKETALTTHGVGWAKFKGKCYNCDKSDHRAYKCPEKKNQEGSRHEFGNHTMDAKNMGITSQVAGKTRGINQPEESNEGRWLYYSQRGRDDTDEDWRRRLATCL